MPRTRPLRGPLERLEARDNPATFLDLSYGASGYAALDGFTGVAKAAELTDDRVVVVGTVAGGDGTTSDFVAVRLTADGRPDPTFGTNGRAVVPFDLLGTGKGADTPTDFVVRPDGGLTIVGTAVGDAAGTRLVAVAQLTAAGALDPTFDGDGRLTFGFAGGVGSQNTPNEIVRLANGSLLVTGLRAATATGPADAHAARLTAAGAFDAGYGTAGVAALGTDAVATAADATGRAFALRRDGTTGGTTGAPGSASNFFVNRFDAAGGFDAGYGVAGRADVARVTVPRSSTVGPSLLALADGGMLASFPFDGGSSFASESYRLTPGGSLDTAFGFDGRTSRFAAGTVVESPAGRLVGGNPSLGPSRQLLVGLTPQGITDATFGENGVIEDNSRPLTFFQPTPGIAPPRTEQVVYAAFSASGSFLLGRFTTVDDALPTVTPAAVNVRLTAGEAQTLEFQVADAETPADDLQVTVATADAAVLPAESLVLGGSGTTRTLTIRPTASAGGSTVVTVTARDSLGKRGQARVNVTVTGGGAGRPTIVPAFASVTITPNSTLALSLVVADAETPAGELTVTATPDDANAFRTLTTFDTGARRYLAIPFPTSFTGRTTFPITVTVTDAAGNRGTAVVLVEQPPFTFGDVIISPATSTLIVPTGGEGTPPGSLFLNVRDLGPADSPLQLTAVADDPALLPPGSITFSPPVFNSDRQGFSTLILRPGPQGGRTTIRITARGADGREATTAVEAIVVPAVRPAQPTVTIVPGATGTVQLSVAGEAAFPGLSVTATADNTALFPAGSVVVTGTGETRTLTLTPAAFQTGMATVSLVSRTVEGDVTTTTLTVTVPKIAETLIGSSQFAVGPDAGGNPIVTFFNPDRSVRRTVNLLTTRFNGGVRTAAADFNRDGVADIAVGSGPGAATRVEVYDGASGQMLFGVDPFEASFTGGVYVAAGDVTGDGAAELVITPDEGGGPRVRVLTGADFRLAADFFGIDDPNFRGGARAAVGDLTGDGVGDLIVAAGFGGGPRVAGYDGTTVRLGQVPVKLFGDFFAFEQGLRNGIFVAAGDVDGDGLADLIAGGGPGGGPRVTAFGGRQLLANTQTPLANFFAGDPNNRGGVRVAVKNLDGDNRADVVTGPGPGGGSKVTAYYGTNLGTPAFDLDVAGVGANGVFVG